MDSAIHIPLAVWENQHMRNYVRHDFLLGAPQYEVKQVTGINLDLQIALKWLCY